MEVGSAAAAAAARPGGVLAAVRTHRLADVAAYLVIGVLSVAVDVGLLVLLAELVRLPLALATAVAFLASVALNFALNRVLAGSGGLLGGQAVRYGLLLTANLALTVVVVVSAEAAGVSYVLAKTLVVVASTMWNYVLYRRWVFARTA